MNAEKLTQKWAVASFFDDIPVGFEFAREDTPLHATLAGVFALKGTGNEIAEILQASLEGVRPLSVAGAEYQQWGEGLTVTVLESSSAFNSLYKKIQDDLLSSGATFNEPQYLGDGFTPHVTVQKTSKLEPGETQEIQYVSLVDMFPAGDGYRRRIHAVINLTNG